MRCYLSSIMKTTSRTIKSTLAVLATAFVLTATNTLWADNDGPRGDWDGDHYNHYILYNNHHGYWDTRGPVRVFINVD